MKMQTKCENCIHDEVCSLKQAFKRSCDEIYNDIPHITVEIKCDHYISAKPTVKRTSYIDEGTTLL